MGKIVRMIPRIVDLPQCVAKRQHPYANDTAKTDKQCKRKAKIDYQGEPLCIKHAEVRALNELLLRKQK